MKNTPLRGGRAMRLLSYILAALAVAGGASSCIEDGVSTSSADQPVFSTDTVAMGTLFTGQVSSTRRMTIRNPHGRGMVLQSVSLSGPGAAYFRLNVDGMAGSAFRDVDIRAKDSIYVLVEATLPPNAPAGQAAPVDVEASMDVVTNGVTRRVVLTGTGQDVRQLRGAVIQEDTTLDAGLPFQVFDTLRVTGGATLTLAPGAVLYFHDRSALKVEDGSLHSLGTAQAPVTLTGDRLDCVVGQIPFSLMSKQWGGVWLTPGSRGNVLTHTTVSNTTWGLLAQQTDLSMTNSVLHNSGSLVLDASHSRVRAVGCELTDAADGVVRLVGGEAVMAHCTVANYYLFSVLGGPALQLGHFDAATDDGSGLPWLSADVSNTIIYGLGTDLSHGSFEGSTAVALRRCLLRSAGTDDANFVNCLWETDPLYRTVREDYVFDYRLLPDSPAIGAADPALTPEDAAVDRYGLQRGAVPDLGAYVYDPSLATEPETDKR